MGPPCEYIYIKELINREGVYKDYPIAIKESIFKLI